MKYYNSIHQKAIAFKAMKSLFIIPIAFTILITSCAEKETAPVKESIRPVRYEIVKTASLTANNTFSGICQSDKEVNLSFKVAGKISRLNIEVGDKVKAGQVIAVIDAVDYDITSDQAKDQYKAAQTQVKSAETQLIANKSNFERIERLYENNSIPLSQYEQAKAAYEMSESQHQASLAQVATAQKQAEAANNQVGYTQLRAPFSGIISKVNVSENELVGSGTPVAVLSANTQPEIKVGVPESLISTIAKGQNVTIHFSSMTDKNFKGLVKEVAYSSNNASTYEVIVKIVNPTDNIRPGMSASVTFSSGASNDNNTLFAPAKGIGQDYQGHFAFVVQKDGENYKVKKTKVSIGELTPKGFEITNGLKAGDKVATAGLKSLLDGLKVKLME